MPPKNKAFGLPGPAGRSLKETISRIFDENTSREAHGKKIDELSRKLSAAEEDVLICKLTIRDILHSDHEGDIRALAHRTLKILEDREKER